MKYAKLMLTGERWMVFETNATGELDGLNAPFIANFKSTLSIAKVIREVNALGYEVKPEHNLNYRIPPQ